jgi:hypothetical protein
LRYFSCGGIRICLDFEISRAQRRKCHLLKQQLFRFLADNPLYNNRNISFIGMRCSISTNSDVVKELHFDWKTVMEMENQYLTEKIRWA